MKSTVVKRLTFIDVARTYAVFLALLSHALLATGTFRQLGESGIYIRQFTRTATPMFLFMFGFMIEYVYVRRALQYGVESIRKRLMVRSFQCYLAYALTSLSSLIGGYKSVMGFAGSLVLFSDSRFGNILRIYAVLLLLTPIIIKLRIKYGKKLILIALVFIALSSPVLVQTKVYTFGMFDRPLNILFGVASQQGGPSVWHSISFMLAGMFVASGLRDRQNNRLVVFYRLSAVMLATSAVLGILFIHESFTDVWRKFADATYRSGNRIEYIIIGIFCSVLIMMLFGLIFGSRSLPLPVRYFLPVGRSSLFAYTSGNVLLNFSGTVAGQWHPLVFLSVFFCCVVLMTRHKERLPLYNAIHDALNGGYKSGS